MSRILIVSKCPTHPITAGNRWAVLSQAKILQQLGNEVHFLYIEESPISSGHKKEFAENRNQTSLYWGEFFHFYKVPKFEKIFFNLKNRFYKKFNHGRQKCDSFYPCRLGNYVNRLDKKIHFDICIVNYFYLTKLFDNISIPKKALHTHDNFAYKDILLDSSAVTALDANQSAKAMQRSPHIFALQHEEAIFFQLLSPKSTVYTIFSKYDYSPQEIIGNKHIVFLSGSNEWNINGLKWFLDYIFPKVLERHPDACLDIGGAICGKLQDYKNNSKIKLWGLIDNPDEFYKLGDIGINPVYQGTGLKIKTFESISYDKVTIVHPHSMSGIFEPDEAPLFVSDNPESWVNYLSSVWADKSVIMSIKKKNAVYMKKMNAYIVDQYKKFLAL